jgi:hypothetical protein
VLLGAAIGILVMTLVVVVVIKAQDDDDETAEPEPTTTTTTEVVETTTSTTEGSGGLDPAEVEESVEDALGESLGGITGGGDDLGLDDEQYTCLLGEIGDDPELLAEMIDAGEDPEGYVYTGEVLAGLWEVLAACDLLDDVAEQVAADDPTADAEQVQCVFEGMTELSPEGWDAIMELSEDPGAMPDDPTVLGEILGLFTDCDFVPEPTA